VYLMKPAGGSRVLRQPPDRTHTAGL